MNYISLFGLLLNNPSTQVFYIMISWKWSKPPLWTQTAISCFI